MLLTQICVVLVLVTGSVAQTKYCCTPPKWECTLNVISGGLVNDQTYFVQEFQNVSMDTTAHKVARVMLMINNGVSSKVTVIQDFDARKEYRISNGVCKVNSLEAWTPKCIPEDATPIITSHFGTADKQVNFTSYMYTRDDDNYVMSVSPVDCTPLYLGLTSYQGNKATGYTIGSYGNFTLGIKDPTVFDVPDICKHPLVHNIRPRSIRSLF